MKVIITIVVGLVVALWWVRPGEQKSPPAAPSPRRASSTPTPSLPQQPGPRPTLEPNEADPERRKHQDELWGRLRTFAADAKLESGQWERFEQDLSELAQIESAAWAEAARGMNAGEVVKLSRELEAELTARCAAHMTPKQVAALRFYFPSGLVAQVRRLHYLPNVVAELPRSDR